MEKKHSHISPFPPISNGHVPSRDECILLWDQYNMMEHIKEHSLMVTKVALYIGNKLKTSGLDVDIPLIEASALLHDIAKTYTIENGGYHTQIGAVWMLHETKNHAIAQCILHHVYWPGPLDIEKYWLPLVIVYADKRVNHNKVVTLEKRLEYILDRYGESYERMQYILYSFRQARYLEEMFCKILQEDLNESSFDSRGMVL